MTAHADHIRPLAARGWSSARIAAELRLTRNQVIGACTRAGIKLAHTGNRRRAVRAALPPLPAGETLKPARSGAAQCRWPMWDDVERATGVFCCRPTDGVYCPEHHARAYQKAASAPATI